MLERSSEYQRFLSVGNETLKQRWVHFQCSRLSAVSGCHSTFQFEEHLLSRHSISAKKQNNKFTLLVQKIYQCLLIRRHVRYPLKHPKPLNWRSAAESLNCPNANKVALNTCSRVVCEFPRPNISVVFPRAKFCARSAVHQLSLYSY